MGVGASVRTFRLKKVEEVKVNNDGAKDADKTYRCEVEHIAHDVSRNVNVLFVCDEWGSSKGGLSTFNRELAANLAKISTDNIKVHCYVCDSNEFIPRTTSKFIAMYAIGGCNLFTFSARHLENLKKTGLIPMQLLTTKGKINKSLNFAKMQIWLLLWELDLNRNSNDEFQILES